ncbi:MAG: hypothetical protein IJL96_06590 [Clostridia bacterium]|nr:hypothetical protein [Clostridia bacterium]MBR0216570.1 hypothetical protein [Clostridia bacterium]
MKKILSLVLVIALALGCVSFSTAEELKVYHDYQTTTNEMEYWLIQMSQGAKELNVLNNCLDGLVYNDHTGALVPLAAESWEHDDKSVVWTFHLREGMVWVDANGEYKGDVVAEDWLTGLEWTLNYAKNEATNTSMAFETLKGAEEYYEYTKTLAETNPEEAAALTYDGKFLETVGIATPDEYTIVYTCKDSTPYFDSVATYACLYPIPQGMIDELGVEGTRALTPDKMWYSGPYTVTTYNEGSEKILTKNPLYWNENSKLFDEVVITMVESVDKAKELFDAGQLDRVALSQSALSTIYNDPENPYYKYLVEARPTKYSYQMHLNYDVWEEDGTPDTNWNTAVANEAFRLSWYYGLDLTAYLERTNFIHPYVCANYGYTGTGVAVNSKGVDYATLVNDLVGVKYSDTEYTRCDPELAAKYKAQAIEELTAEGVTFPVEVNYFISGSSTVAAETAKVLKQTFEECLGADYINFQIKTYVSSLKNEVRAPHLASFYINGWGADFGDPVNFVGQETYGEDNAYYSIEYSNINSSKDEDLIATYKEFTNMVAEARTIVDDYDARLDAFAKSEAYFVQHALTIPCYIDISWQLTKVNDYTKCYAAYGISTYRYENWETKTEMYTTEEYDAIKAAYNAAE